MGSLICQEMLSKNQQEKSFEKPTTDGNVNSSSNDSTQNGLDFIYKHYY